VNQTDPINLVRLHVQVTGRVQGVGFRAFVLEAAKQASLTGWVRNLGYDQVETMAEGPRNKLEWFAGQLKAGAPGGRVDLAKIDWESGTGEFNGFVVRSSR
jgi:acylphosphatase